MRPAPILLVVVYAAAQVYAALEAWEQATGSEVFFVLT